MGRSFFSGKNIRVLIGEVEALARQHGNLFCNISSSDSSDKPVCNPLIQLHLTMAYNTLHDLEGATDTPEEEVSSPLEKVIFLSNDDIIKDTIETERYGVLQAVLSYQAIKTFMLRDMDSALQYTNLYIEHFVVSNLSCGLHHFCSAYSYFIFICYQ